MIGVELLLGGSSISWKSYSDGSKRREREEESARETAMKSATMRFSFVGVEKFLDFVSRNLRFFFFRSSFA